MFLDFVKSRSINVFLQMAGRIMRPDKENKKKYAILFEFVKNNSETGDEDLCIEYNLVHQIVAYYEMIINMSCYDVRDNDKFKMLEIMKNMYDNTIIDKFENKITVKQSLSKTICEIKFYENVIDWSKFTNLFKSTMNKKLNINKEDEFNNTIKKIKLIDIFSKDIHFWDEYDKLDHRSLKILDTYSLKNDYPEIWKTKTWYEVLGTNNKLSYDDLQEYVMSNKLKYIDKSIYLNLCKKNKHMPIFPDEYYKYKGWIDYENTMIYSNIFY